MNRNRSAPGSPRAPSPLAVIVVCLAVSSLLIGPIATNAEDPDEAAAFTGPLAGSLDEAGRKLIALAEAIPADKYSWRPTPEVRSVSEVLMHVVGGNLTLLRDLGGGSPEGIEIASTVWDLARQRKRWEEEVVDKSTVVEMLKGSFAYAVAGMPTITELDERVATWGFPASKKDYLLILQGHAHEHLGQMVAYTRGLGIAPPWSRRPETAVADSVATFEDSTARADIASIDGYGNLMTTLVAADLGEIGVEVGQRIIVAACGGSNEVLYANELFDVRPGESVAFVAADGHVTVAVSFGSAAETLGCSGVGPTSIRPAN